MRLRNPIDLGAAIRDRRRELRLAQGDLAKQVGVSRKWIIGAEQGKLRGEIGLLLRTLDVLGLRLSVAPNNAVTQDTAAAVAGDIDAVLDRARSQSS